MKENRVQKYNDYRNCVVRIEEEVRPIVRKNGTESEKNIQSTSTTLPLDEVIKEVNSTTPIAERKIFTKKGLLIIICCILGVAIVIGLIVLGVLAWRK